MAHTIKQFKVSHKALLSFLCFFLLGAQTIYACSPEPNFILKCNGEESYHWVYESADTGSIVDDCPALLDAKEYISTIALDPENILIAASTETFEGLIPDNNCFLKTIAKIGDSVVISVKAQPYCVTEFNVCHSPTSLTISTSEKIFFDLNSGNFLLPVLILLTAISGMAAGFYLAQEKTLPTLLRPIISFLKIVGMSLLILGATVLSSLLWETQTFYLFDSITDIFSPFNQGLGPLLLRVVPILLIIGFIVWLIQRPPQAPRSSIQKTVLFILAATLLAPLTALFMFLSLMTGTIATWIIYPPVPIFIFRIGVLFLALAFFISKKWIWKLPIYSKI
ncbi:MAG: hypothetical protein AB8G95_22480 [Anaerolineae bacterium]